MGKLGPYGLKTASLPHGIDTSLFNKNNKRNDLRRIHGLEANDPIIINIRGLVPIFDPITFIRAIPYVVKKFTSVKFLVTYQKEHKETYEKLIQRLNVDKNVIILDWMPNEKVAEYLAIADIYVSTSLSDGASNALFEGMSCELAPVVTDIPANRCWIKDGENGFLFKSGDYLALAEKINCLLGDKDKRKLFGKKCREIVCEKADYEIQMAKTEKVYQVLVNEYSKK
jgi:glycosyltransferase involved in cell wall biosynthesis